MGEIILFNWHFESKTMSFGYPVSVSLHCQGSDYMPEAVRRQLWLGLQHLQLKNVTCLYALLDRESVTWNAVRTEAVGDHDLVAICLLYFILFYF